MIFLIKWAPLIFTLFWCGFHAVLNFKICIHSERGIFLYHLYAFAIFAVLLVVLMMADHISVAMALGALSFHGIYSLSYLELWSLSQGSYSLGILDMIHSSTGVDYPQLLSEMNQVGTTKKTDRISSLSRMGLVHIEAHQVRLSFQGAMAAITIGALRSLAGIRDVG